jgi:DNA helicase IV
MATKRTKADKAQRQADELESKSERRPAQVPRKTTTPENFSQAAAMTVREATKKTLVRSRLASFLYRGKESLSSNCTTTVSFSQFQPVDAFVAAA